MSSDIDLDLARKTATKALGGPPLTIAHGDLVDGVVAAIERAARTWRLAGSVVDWSEELVQLDIARVNTALVKLRRQVDGTLTIARFFAEYRSLQTEDASTTEQEVCGRCDGTGWVDAPGRVNPDGRVSTAVAACSYCDNGIQARRVQLRVIEGGRR